MPSISEMHRWEYDPVLWEHRCLPPEPFLEGSPDRCKGCGVMVGDKALAQFWQGESPGIGRAISLNLLASLKV